MTSSSAWSEYLMLKEARPEAFVPNEHYQIIYDKNIIDDFQKTTGRLIGVNYKSAFSYLIVDLVNIDGTLTAFERLLAAVPSGAVVGVPILNDKFVLLNQYRHALRSMQYAFPRGFGEEGIEAKENVIKELEEELGATVCKSELLGHVVPDSGISSKEASIFLCELSSIDFTPHYEGIEEYLELSLEDIECWIAEGRITDGFTLAAMSLYRTRRANS